VISDTALSNLRNYYQALHGRTEAIVQAFQDARAQGLVADEIEWVEPFDTLHGARRSDPGSLPGTHNCILRALLPG
jgi:hypothetical protein